MWTGRAQQSVTADQRVADEEKEEGGKKHTVSRRLSRGAVQDAALNEWVDSLRRMFLRSDCHNVMPVSGCSEEFPRRRSISENCRQQVR